MSKSYYVRLGSGTIIKTDDVSRWPEGERMTATAGKAALKAESMKALRRMLKPGDTVHCVLRHISKSGMFRRIDFYKVRRGDMLYLSGHMANVLDLNIGDKDGLPVGGCGRDMGFAMVYDLARSMWPKGTPKDHHGEPNEDGGYGLVRKWA